MSVEVPSLVRALAAAAGASALLAAAVLTGRAAEAIRIVGGTGALPRRRRRHRPVRCGSPLA